MEDMLNCAWLAIILSLNAGTGANCLKSSQSGKGQCLHKVGEDVLQTVYY